MARWIGVFLAVILLFCGCANEGASEVNGGASTTTTGPVSANPGLYIPQSSAEQASGGAVRSFRLDGDGYYGCILLGADMILLRQNGDAGELSLYRGENLEHFKTVSLGENVTPAVEQLQISQQGIAYYDSINKAMAFLDANLVETKRVSLSEDVTGSAWLSEDWKKVYYCTAKGISVMDLQTHISYLLKEQEAANQELTGIFGAGELLRYVVETKEDQKKNYLVEAASGVIMQEGDRFNDLQTQDNHYFLPQSASGVTLMRFGTEETHRVLWPAEADEPVTMLFPNNATVTAQADGNHMALAYYDLGSGNRTAAVKLEGVTEVFGLQGDGQAGLWFFGKGANGSELLYHWDTAKSQTADETVYTEPYFTRENPNEQGLAECAVRAKELADRFGIEILIWKDAADASPKDYVFTEAHITQAYDAYLSKLEQMLSTFPEGFFKKTPEGKLRFALVQGISGKPEWGGLESTTVLQFWDDSMPVIALVMSDSPEADFYHGVAHFMETRIMSKTTYFYEWYTLNPHDFDYDNSYVLNLQREDSPYIHGEERHFIDLFSMSFAKEDRARIFEYACLPGNEEYFETEAMQEKLERICKGIRKAFGYQKTETPFLWEQYLKN